MLNIYLITVGKLKESFLTEAANEYIKRLNAYCKLTVIEIDEQRITENPSKSQIDAVLLDEGRRIISKIPKSVVKIALCIEGKQLSSTELSSKITEYTTSGKSSVAFIIGGSHGLSDEVKALADLKLSVSKMTFPHQLFRVMLLEQIYRALSISSGGKYHK